MIQDRIALKRAVLAIARWWLDRVKDNTKKVKFSIYYNKLTEKYENGHFVNTTEEHQTILLKNKAITPEQEEQFSARMVSLIYEDLRKNNTDSIPIKFKKHVEPALNDANISPSLPILKCPGVWLFVADRPYVRYFYDLDTTLGGIYDRYEDYSFFNKLSRMKNPELFAYREAICTVLNGKYNFNTTWFSFFYSAFLSLLSLSKFNSLPSLPKEILHDILIKARPDGMDESQAKKEIIYCQENLKFLSWARGNDQNKIEKNSMDEKRSKTVTINGLTLTD